jgi:hypothetical protein
MDLMAVQYKQLSGPGPVALVVSTTEEQRAKFASSGSLVCSGCRHNLCYSGVGMLVGCIGIEFPACS